MKNSLILRNPFRSVISTSAADQIFDDFFKDFGSFDAVEKMMFSNPSSVPYDIISLQDANGKEVGVEIRYALANYSKEDIKVEVTGDILTVSAGKTEGEDYDVPDNTIRRKCVYNGIKKSKWQMSYRLGRDVEIDKISPVFKNGTLTLVIPYYDDKTVKDACYSIEVK